MSGFLGFLPSQTWTLFAVISSGFKISIIVHPSPVESYITVMILMIVSRSFFLFNLLVPCVSGDQCLLNRFWKSASSSIAGGCCAKETTTRFDSCQTQFLSYSFEIHPKLNNNNTYRIEIDWKDSLTEDHIQLDSECLRKGSGLAWCFAPSRGVGEGICGSWCYHIQCTCASHWTSQIFTNFYHESGWVYHGLPLYLANFTPT